LGAEVVAEAAAASSVADRDAVLVLAVFVNNGLAPAAVVEDKKSAVAPVAAAAAADRSDLEGLEGLEGLEEADCSR